MRLLIAGVVLLLGVSPTFGSLAASVKSVHMLTDTPPGVARICREAERELRARHDRSTVVCPRLVPDAPVLRYPGTFGLLTTATNRSIYGLTFNNGGDDAAGSLSLHWIIGVGTWPAIRRWVLSDALNEVKGKPTYLGTRVVAAHRVQLYRFPEHPAGGPFGSHTIAFAAVGSRAAFASVHGAHLDASMAMAVAYALQMERATSRFVRSRSSA
jgi:hypothetical protein